MSRTSQSLLVLTASAVFGLGLSGIPAVHLQGAASQAAPPATQAASPSPAAPSPSPQRALLNQYCVRCHSDRLHTAGLTLEKLDLQDIGGNAELWEKVATKIRGGAMPPPASPRPDQPTLDGLATWLETELDRVAVARPQPGRIAVHRLNRSEYANAIRDLLALEVDGRSFLVDEDPSVSGFDNTAGALSISPTLIERYLSGARRISHMAVGDGTVPPVFDTYKVPKMLKQDDRTAEDLPFASRGGIAVRHRFLVDGEYVVKVRLQSQLYQYIQGLGRPHPLDVRVDGKRVKQFIVGGDAPGKPAPDSYAGDIDGDPEWEKYMHFADAGLEVRFPAQAGTHVVGVSFAEYTPEPEGVLQPAQNGASGDTYNQLYYDNPLIETVSIGGPYNPVGAGDTPSRRKIFVCRPKGASDERACAINILAKLARGAFRRPETEADIQTLLSFYEAGRKQGTFETGIQSALTRILADPEFLVRIERSPERATAGSIYRVNDLDLASRLSFFLWSSVPDDQLLDLGVRGKLHEPQILNEQVRRMLADDRSKALIDNFGSQWVNLPKLRGVTPSPDDFPDFDENLRDAFQQETKLFLESQIRGDRSLIELLSADYTFVNERLARHYGLPGVYGSSFRRVKFDHGERGGLLGQGSILTVTSYANRTSPVFRGKWVLESLLGTPPPQPPPDVPDLKEGEPGKPPASVRERMEEHRKNPMCSACHARMDPLGFALENFNAVGKFRSTNEDGTPIDSTDTLPDGTRLNGIGGLRTFLLARQSLFARALTEKLLAYALGRNVEYFDRPAVRNIAREAAPSDYRWSTIIQGIVSSVPFQMSAVSDQSGTAASGPPSAPAVSNQTVAAK